MLSTIKGGLTESVSPLLDDNNRRTLARLHFNGVTTKYLGTFKGKEEERHLLSDLTDIYKLEKQIASRITELESGKGEI